MISTLLGHLAQFASFSTQGEVLCTQGLAYLLQDPQAKQDLASVITCLRFLRHGALAPQTSAPCGSSQPEPMFQLLASSAWRFLQH
jgi:hypothetical protein